jgi:hypothetical protein
MTDELNVTIIQILLMGGTVKGEKQLKATSAGAPSPCLSHYTTYHGQTSSPVDRHKANLQIEFMHIPH